MRHGREKTSTIMAERREAFWLLAFGGSETPMGRGEDVGERLVPLCQGRERHHEKEKRPMFTWPSKFSNATGAIAADLEAEARAARDT